MIQYFENCLENIEGVPNDSCSFRISNVKVKNVQNAVLNIFDGNNLISAERLLLIIVDELVFSAEGE